MTASCLFNISVSLEIDGSSGSFRANCAYAQLEFQIIGHSVMSFRHVRLRSWGRRDGHSSAGTETIGQLTSGLLDGGRPAALDGVSLSYRVVQGRLPLATLQ